MVDKVDRIDMLFISVSLVNLINLVILQTHLRCVNPTPLRKQLARIKQIMRV